MTDPSLHYFYISAIGALSFGMLGGVYRVFKQENFKFVPRVHGPGVVVATKALMYGTALCFGTFGFGSFLFMSISGIKSFKEFSEATKSSFKTSHILKDKMSRAEQETDYNFKEEEVTKYLETFFAKSSKKT